MKVIGISCWYHDSAVTYIENGIIKLKINPKKRPINPILVLLGATGLGLRLDSVINSQGSVSLAFSRDKNLCCFCNSFKVNSSLIASESNCL